MANNKFCTDCKLCLSVLDDLALACGSRKNPPDAVDKYLPIGNESAKQCPMFRVGTPQAFTRADLRTMCRDPKWEENADGILRKYADREKEQTNGR